MVTVCIIWFGFEKTYILSISYGYHNMHTLFSLHHEHGIVSEFS